ncbi:hypothetical protein DICVIV_06950 [Dictyocaulus viviparus]|uniref:Uncharacterized protein n=1 Tax=Dictyocaulus viviparus TaxID=29172 RepID=A0A0D8XT85_DICVI|nr:hypothetical protein DICVIV_06950 [Dictyocaulus viviparus]
MILFIFWYVESCATERWAATLPRHRHHPPKPLELNVTLSDSRTLAAEVPRSRKENRQLKQGFVDDNNDTLLFLDLPMIWPASAFAIFSTSLFVVAIATALHNDYIPTTLELKRTFFALYGSTTFSCNTTITMPTNGIPSILNLFEINASGNVFFRLCVCIPMVVRLFISYIQSAMLQAEYEPLPFFYRISVEIVPMLTFVEVFSLALFSIITSHSDSPDLNGLCKVTFLMTAVVNMVFTTTVQYSYGKSSKEKVDHLSAAVKTLMACVFCYLSPQYFLHQHSAISFPICHSYVTRMNAYTEYVMIIAYFFFHLTSLIDIRNIAFICYPRTCSGECEPLDPKNFVKHAKFEHCRAFEYQQRRVRHL